MRFWLPCSEFNCSIWRIDVGMSSGVFNSTPEVDTSLNVVDLDKFLIACDTVKDDFNSLL